MIIGSHFAYHSGFDFPAGVTANKLWKEFINMGGGLGNGIFVMLSGYFLINSDGLKFRKALNLWARIFFWSALLYGLFVLSGIRALAFKDALKALLPVTRSLWWFASTYFMLYLIHPYLNRLLHGFTQEEYKHFLKTAVLGWCVISTMTHPEFSGANHIADFVCVYSVAGYIRLYAGNLGGKKFLLYALGFIGLNFMSAVIINVISMRIPVVDNAVRHMFAMMRPFTLLAVSSLVIFFRNLNIPDSKVINTIASASFGVYLIHDSRLVRPLIWKKLFHVASYQDSPYLIPYSLAVILAVYISCTVIDLVRSKIFRTLSRGYLS